MRKFFKQSSYLGGLLFIGFFTLALIGGCGGQSKGTTPAKESGSEKVKVRYAAFTGINGIAVQLGNDKGFFKDAGLDVEFIDVKDPIAGLASEEIDFADVSTTIAIVGAGRGAPIKIVSSMFRSKGPFYLISTPDIKRIEDLKGKKVGIAAFGSGLEICARTILAKHGLSPDDVTFIANGRHSQAYASLESGQVAATIINDPFAALGEKTGKARLLARGWDYMPSFHTGVLVASNKFIAQSPEALKKILAAYFKSQEYAKTHRDEYLDYATKVSKFDRSILLASLEREDILWENNPDVNLADLNDTQRIQIEMGFQDKMYDVSKFVDLRFIPKK